VPYRSTRLILHPIGWTRGRTLLRFIAPVVLGVQLGPELHARLSELNNTTIVGKFYLMDGAVWIEHNLLGESLDWEQFRAVLASVAHHADHLDEQLISEFGGHRWSEVPERKSSRQSLDTKVWPASLRDLLDAVVDRAAPGTTCWPGALQVVGAENGVPAMARRARLAPPRALLDSLYDDRLPPPAPWATRSCCSSSRR
jgi:hypothetical protein